jgi:hypothetical protein
LFSPFTVMGVFMLTHRAVILSPVLPGEGPFSFDRKRGAPAPASTADVATGPTREVRAHRPSTGQ